MIIDSLIFFILKKYKTEETKSKFRMSCGCIASSFLQPGSFGKHCTLAVPCNIKPGCDGAGQGPVSGAVTEGRIAERAAVPAGAPNSQKLILCSVGRLKMGKW